MKSLSVTVYEQITATEQHIPVIYCLSLWNKSYIVSYQLNESSSAILMYTKRNLSLILICCVIQKCSKKNILAPKIA